MAFGTRVWSAGKTVMLGGALLATYVVCAIVAMQLTIRAREVSIPDLVGRTANEASAIVVDLGLALKVDDAPRPDPKVPPGRVLVQDPQPGAVARRQRTVRVWLSSGPRAILVPALVGETERTAQLRVVQSGLALSGVDELHDPERASDLVVAQSPPARSAAERVMLLVNRGAPATTYLMPDVTGASGERAAEILRRHGFTVTMAPGSPATGVPAGTVTRTTPPAGAPVATGETISMEVSR